MVLRCRKHDVKVYDARGCKACYLERTTVLPPTIQQPEYSKEFEAFCAEEGYAGDIFKANLWRVWKASREAIEVDLPEPFDKYESGEGMYFADEVDKAIETAGLKVKA